MSRYKVKPLLEKVCPICKETYTTKQEKTIVPTSHERCYSTHRNRLAGAKSIGSYTFTKDMIRLRTFLKENRINPIDVIIILRKRKNL